ncbi:hypothetical protein D9M71_54800 [compost metagenome]
MQSDHARVVFAREARGRGAVGKSVGAEVVALQIGNHSVVRVAGTDYAHFIGVVPTGFLHGHAILPSLPDVAAIDFRRTVVDAKQETHDFIIGKFIGWRQFGVGFGSALDLVNFGEGFIAHPRLRPGGINGPATVIDVHRKHQAVAEVGIVGDRQYFIALFPLIVHPAPQVLGFVRVEGREGQVRHLLRVAEKHVAVHVLIVRCRGPFIGDKRGELAGLVVLVGDGDVLLPDVAGHLRINQFLDGIVQAAGDPFEHPVEIFRSLDHQFLRDGQFAEVRLRIVGQGDHAHVFRVIGHAMEIQRSAFELHFKPHRVLDRHAKRVLVGLLGIDLMVADQVGIDRPGAVRVRLAKVNLAVRIALCQCQ